MSIILEFKYYGTPCNVKKIQTGDILRDYQLSKSTKILHISNGYLKSTSSTPGLSNIPKLRFKSNITGILQLISTVLLEISKVLELQRELYYIAAKRNIKVPGI